MEKLKKIQAKTIKNSLPGESDTNTLDSIRLKWELFIDKWIECRFNGTEAYMQVFQPKNRNVGGVEALHLIRNPKFKILLEQILAVKYGLNEENVKIWSLQARNDVKFSPEVRTRNNELLGKILGMFNDTDNRVAIQVNIIKG